MFQSCSSFFLCLQGQPELCGSYHLLQSCFSFFVDSMDKLSRSVATIFSSLAFPSSSVSMANLSRLVAVSSLSFLSNSFFITSFQSFESGLVLFLVVFRFLLALSFSRLIFSLSFPTSSVSDALLALSFSFLSERCFFVVHAKAAL